MITITNGYFKIDTLSSTYLFKVNPIGTLEHIYYGKKITTSSSYEFLEEANLYGGGVEENKDGYRQYNDCGSFEFSTRNRGDYREVMADIEINGDSETRFFYKDAKIVNDFVIPGLPNSLNKLQTLIITLIDQARKLELNLYYSIFLDSDIIVRSASLVNKSKEKVTLNRFLSSQVDILDEDFEVVTLNGFWGKERYQNVNPLGMGVTKVDSKQPFSSSNTNPYVVLKTKDCQLNNGTAYGFNLVYSGSHVTYFDRNSFHKVRIMNGINDFCFSWTLKENEVFYTPESTMCFSSSGLNGLTQNYHKFIKANILRGKYQNTPRPIVLNNWEGTYFNFTEEKLLSLAKKGKEVGVELFVLDDGWFGKRNDDASSLGDWDVNLEKLPGGIKALSKKINELGLQFGLWFEPEMVSVDSNLYRTHPDWALTHPLYEPLKQRNQLVLNLAKDEVVDYLIASLSKVFKEGNLSYVKWDCNRFISDYYVPSLNNQKELPHRYMLGLYRLLETLTKTFPDILFEGCSAGGNRFDMGILSYMPQIWCSDNTDAYARMSIQEGTLSCYPQCTIGAHVSSTLSHQTLRTTTLENKFNVAAIGAFGYELDLTKLSRDEIRIIKEQIKWYKKYRNTLQFGQYYLNKSIFTTDNYEFTIVNQKKNEAIYFLGNKEFVAYQNPKIIKPSGLNLNYTYEFSVRPQYLNPLLNKGLKIEEENHIVDGLTLTNAGIRLTNEWLSGNDRKKRIMEDFGTRLYLIKKK